MCVSSIITKAFSINRIVLLKLVLQVRRKLNEIKENYIKQQDRKWLNQLESFNK